MLRVRPATLHDRAAFLEWAAIAEPLFGPMVEQPEFLAGLEQCLASDAALVVEDGAGRPIGGLLLARAEREIAWLVVAPAGRGLGAGAALVQSALELLGPGPVKVETFALGAAEGVAARRLYERFGFTATGVGGTNPAGLATERMVRESDPVAG